VNHKRKRPKHQRAGCLFCKPQKDEREPKPKRLKPNQRRKLQPDDVSVTQPWEERKAGRE
jgi:hypothetical protein